jgi:hypothetical protein
MRPFKMFCHSDPLATDQRKHLGDFDVAERWGGIAQWL